MVVALYLVWALAVGLALGAPAPVMLPTHLTLALLATVCELGSVRLPGTGFFSASFAATSTLAILPGAGPALAWDVALVSLLLRTLVRGTAMAPSSPLHSRTPTGIWREAATDLFVLSTCFGLAALVGSHSVLMQIPLSWLATWLWAVAHRPLARQRLELPLVKWERALGWVFPHRLAARCLGPILTLLAGIGATPTLWVIPLMVGLHRAVQAELLRNQLEEVQSDHQQATSRLHRAHEVLDVKEKVEALVWELGRRLSQCHDRAGAAREICEVAPRWVACQRVAVFTAERLLWALPPAPGWDYRQVPSAPRALRRPETLCPDDGFGYLWPLAGEGALYLGRAQKAFREEEVQLVGALAGQAVLGLQSAGRFEELPRWMESAKLASVGQLAAGLAHELNTPIGAVSLRFELVRSLLEDPKLQSHFDTIDSALVRVQNILRRLLYYSRDGAQLQEEVDVGQVLTDTLDRSELEIVRDLQPLAPMKGTPAELQQLFAHLLDNAAWAVHEPEARGQKVRVKAWQDGPTRRICIQDQGPGFPPAILDRVCEPFFTTRPVGSAMGLGLTVSQRIAERHGGVLRLGNSTDPQWGGEVLVSF